MGDLMIGIVVTLAAGGFIGWGLSRSSMTKIGPPVCESGAIPSEERAAALPSPRRAVESAPSEAARRLKFKVVRFEVTAYCPCEACCGPDATGITASGKPVAANSFKFVAAPRGIPFGTMIAVPGYNHGKAVPVLDRGGAIGKGRLDVFLLTHREALAWGRKTLDCLVYEKESDR